MKLKELRLQNGKSQKDMAELLKMSQTGYGQYETGRIEPDINTLIFLADYYGCSIDYLLDHKSPKQDFGYLNDNQIKLIELSKILDDSNLAKVISYCEGIISAIKKD